MKYIELKTQFEPLGITEDLWKTAMKSSDRIERITTEQGDWWLKKAAPARGVFRYHALNLFSWVLRLPLLKAVPQPGGQAAIKNEYRRLEALSKAGVLVPKIVVNGDDWLLIEHLGESIVKTMKQTETAQQTRQSLLLKCLAALKHLHQNQQYLSQGFIRNMLIVEATQQIAFIDFKDDPSEVMSLAQAQARDLLLLVNSTARFFVDDQQFLQASLMQFMQDHNPEVIVALRATTKRMQWIANVPLQKLLGHDYQKLKVGILALKNI